MHPVVLLLALAMLALGIFLGMFMSGSGGGVGPGTPATSPAAQETPAPEPAQTDTRYLHFRLYADQIFAADAASPVERGVFEAHLSDAKTAGQTVEFSYDDTVTGKFVEDLKQELHEIGVNYTGLD